MEIEDENKTLLATILQTEKTEGNEHEQTSDKLLTVLDEIDTIERNDRQRQKPINQEQTNLEEIRNHKT